MASSLFGQRPQAPVNGSVQQTTTNPQPSFTPPANLGQIKSLWNMMQAGGNQQSILRSLLEGNPQMKTVMDLVEKHNGDAKAAFYEMAQQKGVDPNQILNLLK